MHDNVFVDSNLWLYAFVLRPGEEVKHARALALLEARNRYTISTQVVSEVSVNLLSKGCNGRKGSARNRRGILSPVSGRENGS